MRTSYSVPCLFVAEKPSIAKTLSETLSRGQQKYRAGPSKYNPCYDFELDIEAGIDFSLPNSGKKLRVTVTSVSGHLKSIDFKGNSRSWLGTSPRELFEAEIEEKITENLNPLADNLRNEAKKAKILVIWTDCDREGEAIGAEIADVCREVNSNLIIKRARFSAANATDLWRAVNSLTILNQKEVDAVKTRQEIDLRLGSIFTRFQTLSLCNKISALDGSMLSFGPCQFPTLGFIVARYEAILSFQKETFWQIKLALKAQSLPNNNQNLHESSQEQLFYFNWARHRLYDKMLALVAYEMCVRHPTATVYEIIRKSTIKQRPLPLSTVEFQVRASKWLKLDSEIAMKAAETLYQRGVISYPRTETEVFSETFDLKTLINELRLSPLFGDFASRLLDSDGFSPPRKGNRNDEAHPPIHPLKWAPDLKELPEIRVYEFVCRHFLACCSKDAVGSESILKVKLAAEVFSAKGLVIHERNYLDVYVYDKWGDKNLPDLKEHDNFVPTALELVSGETTPPDLLSEADLIRLMDKNGIGTDATIQDHIKTVQERNYAQKIPEKQNRFAPSNLGVALIRAYNSMGHDKAFSKPELRSEMERDLIKICRGEKRKEEVISDVISKYKQIYLDILAKKQILIQHVESVFMGLDSEETTEQKYDHIVQSGFSKCGNCSQFSLELRKNSRDGRLILRCTNLQCSKYDKILGQLPNRVGQELKPRQDLFCCPICSYQVISVISEDRAWFLCPSCYVEPPLEALEIEDMTDLSSLPCFKCTKFDCQLSGKISSEKILPCSKCRTDSLVLKRFAGENTSVSSYSLRCQAYPSCKGSIRIPNCVKEVKISKEVCTGCNSKKLMFYFFRQKVQPGTPLSLIECPNFLNCSSQSVDFKEILEMENFGMGSSTSHPNNVANAGNANHSRISSKTTTALTNHSNLQPQYNLSLQNSYGSFNNKGSIQRHEQSRNVVNNLNFGSTSSNSFSQTRQDPTSIFPASNSKICNVCGSMLTELISNSEKNPGRKFLKCKSCNFFEWVDSSNNNHNINNNFNSNNVQFQNQPTCYKCGLIGHFASNCPQRISGTSSMISSSTQSDVCFKCNQAGHWASNCPNLQHQQQRTQVTGAPSARQFQSRPASKLSRPTFSRRTCTGCGLPLPKRKRKCECGQTYVSKKNQNEEEVDEEEI